MAADPKQIEQELDRLEKSITLLKRDFEIYFAGASKTPPTDQRDKLDKVIKKMATSQGMSYAQRFKYNSIISRFTSYLDLWNKQLRLKEEGRSPSRVTGLTTEARRAMELAGQKPVTKQEEGTREMPTDPFAKIYTQYLQTREEVGEGASNMTFDGFVKVVTKQREAILEKFHCKDVEFYVSVEQGHTKLKARPIK
jgi:hypothetical protein